MAPPHRYLAPLITIVMTFVMAVPAASAVATRGGPPVGAMLDAVDRPPPVVIVVMENKNYGQIVGNPDAAYINDDLIPGGTLYTNSHSTADPSLPNYLSLTAGSTRGCSSNLCETNIPGANLFRQLTDAGVGWRVWASSIPWPCARQNSGRYAVRHNPAVYYTNVRPEPCRSRVVDYPAPLPDQLPRFTFIVPNVCQDMHDCSIATGDAWLSRRIPPLLKRGAIVIMTFDETAGALTRVVTVVTGPGIEPGARNDHRLTHYGVLAGLEDRFGLWRLRNAKDAWPLPL
jgi:hypothetical protein